MTVNVLIVEDSPTQAAKLDFFLEEHDFRPTIAADAETALELLGREPFDLVISDIVMPGISGYELCRRIKASSDWKNIPVVLLTTLSDPMDIIQGLECGADNFCTKPYQPEQLLRRINTVLENRRMAAEGKLRVGFEVSFLGRRFAISSDRQQILDLLISTFEQIVETNHELERRKEELAIARARVENYARQLEERVEVSEARYQALLQNVGDAIITIDRNGRVVTFNRAAEQVFGLPASDALGMAPDELVVLPEGILASASSAQHSYETYEVTGRKRDGSTFPFEVVVTDVSFGGNSLLCISGRDITDRRQAEAALIQRETAFRTMVEGSIQGLLVAELGTPLFVNGAFARMYGYTTDEILKVGQTAEFYHPDERARIQGYIDSRAAGDQSIRRYEARSIRKDGSTFWTEQMTSVVDWFGRKAVQIVTVDITERKQLEADLRQAQKMDAIGKLTGGIAHDFNNLLTVVIGNLQLLEEESGSGPKSEEWVKSALGAAMRGADLTRRLLAFARRQVLAPQIRDINELVSGLEDLFRRTLGDDIDLKTNLAGGLWLTRIDPGQLEHALLNLVVNARDAMPTGGALTIETHNETLDAVYTASHAEVSEGPHVMIAVSDTGSGMSAEVIEKAFEPFFTTKPEGHGTGLGLSMVYGFIKQSGGHIKIYSEVGRGTTIKLYLPADRDGRPDAPLIPGTSLETQRATEETILLVEDDSSVREVGANILQRLGYKLVLAENGTAALKILEAGRKIDLLFTDIMMQGGMSGVELAKTAREKWPNLKVLFCSGFAENAFSRNDALEPGTFFISKPYDRAKLATMLRQILDA